jgi:hypothetical protein
MATLILGGNDYPSFATVAQADVVNAGDVLRAVPWAVKNGDAKMRGLITATRIFLRLRWCGDTPSLDNPPQAVIDGVSMMANDVLIKPKLQQNPGGTSNIKVAQAGSARVEFFIATTVGGGTVPLPLDIWETLQIAGLVGCGDDAGGGPYVGGLGGDHCHDRWVEWRDTGLWR